MKGISAKAVHTYAKKYGIEFAPLGDIGWATRLESNNDEKFLTLNGTERMIFFSIDPLLKVKCHQCRPKLTQHLLLLNAQVPLIKYAIDEKWDISLTVEYPIDAFSYALFKMALDAIKDALKQHYAEIVKIAKD